jgi:hypothetical protein
MVSTCYDMVGVLCAIPVGFLFCFIKHDLFSLESYWQAWIGDTHQLILGGQKVLEMAHLGIEQMCWISNWQGASAYEYSFLFSFFWGWRTAPKTKNCTGQHYVQWLSFPSCILTCG